VPVIESQELYDRLAAMSEEERVKLLDPICETFSGLVDPRFWVDRGQVLPNRIFALAALKLYEDWQREIFERD
jgi:hypothetical protein